MRLKRLEVFGFKSFFDKTVITFKQGITGIVGPNGCGKSNFSDAILWVLGEQSPKTLRGERMEDVIFSGTEQRKPLSVAEVSLTIGDIANELPPPYTPYAELTLSRRLYRSGESEYLINKTPCRLKDIRDLLIDMGAGYHAHTIIEQGRVDDLITASPMQRREIVEEAAGIAKYRLRKAEALRKLEATERNLTRVSDIIGEVKRQRNALDRQAKKAEKCRDLTEALKSLELQVARHEWMTCQSEESELKQEEGRLEEKSAGLSARLSALETKQTQNKLGQVEQERALGDLSRDISEVEKQIQRFEGKVETIRAQRQEWRETDSRTEKEIAEIQEETTALEAELAVLEDEIAVISKTLPAEEASLAAHEAKKAETEASAQADNAALETARMALFDLGARLTTAKNNLLHFQNRREMLARQQERLRQEKEDLEITLEQTEKTFREISSALQNNEAALTLRQKDRREKTALVTELESSTQKKEHQLFQVKEDISEIKARIASHEGFYRGFLNEREAGENPLLQLEGLQGMVADLIDVPAKYERALEAVLESRLRGIVVENHAEIQKGIHHLKETERGRGTFFPRDPRTPQSRFKPPPTQENTGILGAARALVRVRAGSEAIADALLDGIVLTSHLDMALAAWKKYPSVPLWVTLAGEIIDAFGVVSGGGQGREGLLAQKRALRYLTDEADRLQHKAERLQSEIDGQEEIIKTTRLALTTLDEKIHGFDVALAKTQNEKQSLSSEITRLQGELETIRFEREEGDEEEAELLKSLSSERALIAGTETAVKEKEALLEARKQHLDAERTTLEGLNESVTQLRMKTSEIKTRQDHALEKEARLRRDKEGLSGRFTEMKTLKNKLREKLALGEEEEKEANASIEALASERSLRLDSLREAQETHAALLVTLDEAAQEITATRSDLNLAHEALQKNALGKVAIEMNRQKIEEAVASRYQIDISHDLEVAEDIPVDTTRAQAETLRRQLEAMGPVNLAAIEEYKELDTRFQFLKTQEDDLMQSIDSLHEAITKINKTTRGLFVETFHTLNQKFAEVYASFFGGGTAELVLLDEAHPLESGIEMLSQPPGKGKRNILLLSGGEKALTAISLLFATFLIHPTPFCLLDEIDAPLDEENTRRFAQTLEKMSDRTQFILVTHNKLTMEIADVLYGVTMEETGISKLVSVNLNRPTDEIEGETAEAVATSG
ncbi:MAG: chromosome segregation protein SMC [Nitrospiria bacterium]